MLEKIIKKLFGDLSEKRVKELKKVVELIRQKQEEYKDLTLDDVKAKTQEFKAKFEGLDFNVAEEKAKIDAILEEIKVDALALVVHTCTLINGKEFEVEYAGNKKATITWNMIPYDVQLIGGLVLHGGDIAEMRTGEGKTLVATLPLYLNALTGNPVHLVTVNDYLADRDAKEMGILYNALGLTVGVVTNSQAASVKKAAYKCDIVYATNNELGFDYLRDNMAHSRDSQAQSKLFFAVVDEVDSILIDEARTPLIISAPKNEPTSKYMKFAAMIKELKNVEDYKIDEKQKTATLTDKGISKVEKMIGVDNIYVSAHYNDLHHIENALRANTVYKKDTDYIVGNGEVMIVDEMTGRVLPGRRYSEGLHQALEAKEGVEIQQESKTLASITFQNYFRQYAKLAGMTGTGITEEEEFYKVYGLEVIVIPTNKPIQREDRADILFKSEEGKYKYLVNLIKDLKETGRPILVGTVSVAKSEYLSRLLQNEKVEHNVLNAKQHEKEAEVVANAGQKGAVTIATNMAGRGTDIKLSDEVKEMGGLIIIGTEKHEARRIDNQLKGRAGRQGDPGMTQFLVSPTDDIMRIFGGDKLFSVFNSPMFASIPEDEPLAESSMLKRRIESVQKQVEGYHFDTRKHVLEYDDVINKHREIIYGKRNKILDSENIDSEIKEMIKGQITKVVMANLGEAVTPDSAFKAVKKVNEFLGQEIVAESFAEEQDVVNCEYLNDLAEIISNKVVDELDNKIKSQFDDEERFFEVERRVLLQSIDELWMNHIDAMTVLRQEVAFVGYAQKNPLIVYKEKAYGKFVSLLDEIQYKVTKALFTVKVNTEVEKFTTPEGVELTEAEAEELLKELQRQAKEQANKSSENNNPLFVKGDKSVHRV